MSSISSLAPLDRPIRAFPPPHLGMGLVPVLGAIAGAIRRELTVRELRRLDDRLLRDIGLDRQDIEHGAGPSRTTVAWDVSTGSHLLGAPGP